MEDHAAEVEKERAEARDEASKLKAKEAEAEEAEAEGAEAEEAKQKMETTVEGDIEPSLSQETTILGPNIMQSITQMAPKSLYLRLKPLLKCPLGGQQFLPLNILDEMITEKKCQGRAALEKPSPPKRSA